MTSPNISRSSSPAFGSPNEARGRDSRARNESPSRERRPAIVRRDSSPMTKLATFGLLASGSLGATLAAPVQARGMSPSPHRALSRIEQDMQQAMQMARRNDPAPGGIDWSKVDYSGVDWSKIDWSKVDYPKGDAQGPPSPSVYSTPGAMPSPSLSSLGRAYETTFGEPSPLATPPVATSITRGFSPSLPPIMTSQPVPTGTASAAVDNEPASPKNTNQAPFKAPSGDINFFSGIDAAQNAVAVVWRGAAPMTFSFFANAGPYQPNLSEAYKSVTLQPGANEVVQLPHGWSGRVQKMTGAIDSDATWAELTFNGWQDETWFDDSYIRGYNGPVEMYLMSTPDQKAGSSADMLQQYPRSQQKMQPRGSAIPATEGYDGTIRFDIIDFWRAHTLNRPGHLEAYIVHNDDSATMTGSDKHLVTEWF